MKTAAKQPRSGSKAGAATAKPSGKRRCLPLGEYLDLMLKTKISEKAVKESSNPMALFFGLLENYQDEVDAIQSRIDDARREDLLHAGT